MRLRLRMAFSTLLAAVLAGSCKLPIIDGAMIAAANDTKGLVTVAANKSITLSWVPDPTAESYTLRYTTNGTEPSAGNGIVVENAKPPLTIANLVNGNPHRFALEARYASGAVKAVGEVTSIPLSDLTLTPMVTVDGSYLRVRWPLIAGSERFMVYRQDGSGGSYSLRSMVNGNEFLDTNVLPDRTYRYKIAPENGSGVLSVAGAGRTVAGAGGTDVLASVDLMSRAPTGMYYVLRSVVVDQAGRYAYIGAIAIPYVSGPKTEGHVLVVDLKAAGLALVADFKLPEPADRVGALALSGNYLFAGSWNTLYMYDVTSLPSSSTQPISSCGLPEVTDISVKEGLLCVTGMYAKSLSTVSFSALGLSVLGGCSIADQPRDLVVSGNYAFVSYNVYTTSYTLLVDRFDISNPASPSLVGGGGFSSSAYGSTSCMALAYPYLYIDATGATASDSKVLALDVSSSNATTLAGAFSAYGCTRKMQAFGSYVVTTEQPTGIRTFGVPDFAHARSQKTINLRNNDPDDFCLTGNRALVLNSESKSYAVATLVDPGVGGGSPVFSETGVSGQDTAVFGDSCYSLEYVQQNPDTYRLTEYDIGDRDAIRKQREISLPFIATQVAVSGRYAFLAEFLFAQQSGRIQVLDLETGQLQAPGPSTGMIEDIAMYGSYAFVSEGTQGVEILDASDPLAPVRVAKISTLGPACKVAFAGTCAYVAMGLSGLGVYDIRDPTRPYLLQVVGGMENAQDVDVSGSYALVADYRNLRVVNVSDPRSAFVKVSLSLAPSPSQYSSGVHKVAFCGSRALVDVQEVGLLVLDVSLPEAPAVIGTVPDTKYESDLVASGSCVFTTSARGYPYAANRMYAVKVF